MKKIFYVDISDIKLESINLSLISKERIDKANLMKDDLKKIQSLISYLLLRYAFNTIGIDITNYNFKSYLRSGLRSKLGHRDHSESKDRRFFEYFALCTLFFH